jgi:monoamine oxidase
LNEENPTDIQRHKMMKIALKEGNHIEDFDDLLELLGPPNDIKTIASPGEFKGIKVGIIGGGLSGMSAAFELRKLGFDITIFEMQEKHIGGRVYTYYFDKNKKFYGELGAMRIPVSHETTWHYINLFNLKTRPFIGNNENAFFYIRNKRVQNDSKGKNVMEKIYPDFNLKKWERSKTWQELIGYGLNTYFSKINPSLRREILQIKKNYSDEIKYLGSLSIRQTLENTGLSEGAIELISSVAPLLGSFYKNSYFEYLQEEYSVDSANRYEIVGGASKLPFAFYQSLTCRKPKDYYNISENNLGRVFWRNGKTVTKIFNEEGNNKVILEYKYGRNRECLKERFDFVICAIPFSSLRNLEIYPSFSAGKMQAIKELNYVSAQKTIFMCNRKFWEEGETKEKIFGGSSNTDLPIQTTWYPSHNGGSKSKTNQGVLLASYNLSQDAIRIGNLSKKIRFQEVKEEVEMVHGLRKGYLDSIVEDHKTIHWNTEKGFYGAFCYYMPGEQQLFAYDSVKPEFDNKVYFAGEHTSLTHAWQQGALNSGMKAANAIAECCKKINITKV